MAVLARVFGSRSPTNEAAAAEERLAVASQLQLTWWRFRRHKLACISGVVVILFYLLAAFADFFATMDPHDTDARRTYAPPQSIRFFDDDWSLRPHVIVLRARRDPPHLPHGPRSGGEGRSRDVRPGLSVRPVRAVRNRMSISSA